MHMIVHVRTHTLLALLLIGSVLFAGQVSAEHIHLDRDNAQCSVCLSGDSHNLTLSANSPVLQIERQYAVIFTQPRPASKNQPVTSQHSRAPPAPL
ncbi:MAG: hypothetical protein R3E73_12600 [Porticoccaceae bacterium]|nr:hypothetical protein [Pseudomonadales bacterium]MCP5171868.1 hypothetical protein [Pseudomonadales bacterium]